MLFSYGFILKVIVNAFSLTPPCASASLSIQGGGHANKALPILKVWCFCCELLPPYFLWRAGEGTKISNYFF